MPYLRQYEIKVGTLVLVQSEFSLQTEVAMIVSLNAFQGFIIIQRTNGKREQVNMNYIRRLSE